MKKTYSVSKIRIKFEDKETAKRMAKELKEKFGDGIIKIAIDD